MKNLTLTLVTPTKKILTSQEVTEVMVPAYMGELNIFSGHCNLVTTLGTGVVTYKAADSTETTKIAVNWGYCEIFDNEVKLLAETAETADMVDKAKSEDAIKEAKTALANHAELTPENVVKFNNKIKKSEARLKVLN